MPLGWDRGLVLVQLSVSIALSATSMSDIRLLAHQQAVFAMPPSHSTVRRTLAPFDARLPHAEAKARAAVRAHIWDLITASERGFSWLAVAGKVLTGWSVLDPGAQSAQQIAAVAHFDQCAQRDRLGALHQRDQRLIGQRCGGEQYQSGAARTGMPYPVARISRFNAQDWCLGAGTDPCRVFERTALALFRGGEP